MKAARPSSDNNYLEYMSDIKYMEKPEWVSWDEVCECIKAANVVNDKKGREFDHKQAGGALYEECSYPLLPIMKLLGIHYEGLSFYSKLENDVDIYTKGVLRYPKAACSFMVGLGVKTEGNLVISGTTGYAYVPALKRQNQLLDAYLKN